MKEAPNSPYATLVFREPFLDEQSVRNNGGVPTAVTFSNGVGSFDGTSSYIKYNKNLKGVYSVRIKSKNLNPSSSCTYIDFRNSSGTGVGYLTGGNLNLSASSGTAYVNGVASAIVNATSSDIVITGMTINCFEIFLNTRYNLTNYLYSDIELFEIYQGTLTASEVKNLYDNDWNKELISNNLLLDYDSTNGYITDRTGKNTLTLTGTEAINIVKNGGYSALITNTRFKQVLGSNIVNAQPITVVYWANYNSVALGRYLMDNGTFFIDGSSNNRLRVRSDGSSSGLTATNFLTPGKTQFIAVTRAIDGTATFYSGDLQNAPVSSGTANSGTPAATSTPLTLLGLTSSNSSGFDGKVMMIKVFYGILDLETITQIWSSTRGKVN